MSNTTATNTWSSNTLAKFQANISITSIDEQFNATYSAGEYTNLSTGELVAVLNEANVPNFICIAGIVHVGYAG